jgi:hypothetical protein
MFGSQNNNMLYKILNDSRTVYTLPDIAMLAGESNFESVNDKINYYVKTNRLNRPRKGIYTKSNYNPLELACKLYTPSYISLEYVLQQTGIIFQYGSTITAVSYLSRKLSIDNNAYSYRKIKNEIIVDTTGINQVNNVNIASPERAFLDTLYLNSNYYFDNLSVLNKERVAELLPVYGSKALEVRVKKQFKP